jgi:hypothetical protein
MNKISVRAFRNNRTEKRLHRKPRRGRPLPQLEILEDRTVPTTIMWNNPAGGNFDDLNNWNPKQVPAGDDVAVINTAANATISILSGESFNVQAVTTGSHSTLSIAGALTVTTGTSTLSGPLTVTNGELMVSGSGATLTANSTTTISSSYLIVQNGGQLMLPQLTSYTAGGQYFQVNGSGSLLDVSALTSLSVPSSLTLYATNGGTMKLANALTSLSNTSIYDTGGSTLTNKLTTLTGCFAQIDGTDAHVADTWTQFQTGNFQVNGGSYTLPNLTNVDQSYVIAESGGQLALPNLTSYVSNGPYFQANGAGSVLDVSALTTLTQQSSFELYAQNGGTLKVGFSTLSNNGNGSLTLDSTNGSTLVNHLTTLSGVSAQIDGDAHVADTWTHFQAGTLLVSGGSYNLPNLTNVDQSYLQAQSGGHLALPNLTSYVANGAYFQANGAGSMLDVSA